MTTNLRPSWRKSSYSNSNSNCVEVAGRPGAIAVRDSKDPGGSPLTFAPSAWQAFTCRVQQG
jgi:hypothetical protein